MKVVNTNKTYRIYGDDLKVHDELPVGTYIVRFSQMQGFYLDRYSGIEVNEDKIYGVHMAKINKVMRSFKQFSRNLGIILSGDKGIGKSLFARILCLASLEAGYPVIVVDQFVPGIHSFLEEIEQEAVILFDEFDKTFSAGHINSDDDRRGGGQSAQTSLLSLLDGLSAGKKLYIVTCNKFASLNEYLINRPGRFHYHFRFEYPTADEIRVYLQDKINKEYWGEIPKVVLFASKVNLNYDCLRAIAYELQNGEKFEEAITDLNILNLQDQAYDITLCLADGSTAYRNSFKLDMFDNKPQNIWMRDNNNMEIVVEFIGSKAKYDVTKGCSVVNGADLNVRLDSDYDDEENKHLTKPVVESMMIARVEKNNYKYAV